jgi:hypothetical protein
VCVEGQYTDLAHAWCGLHTAAAVLSGLHAAKLHALLLAPECCALHVWNRCSSASSARHHTALLFMQNTEMLHAQHTYHCRCHSVLASLWLQQRAAVAASSNQHCSAGSAVCTAVACTSAPRRQVSCWLLGRTHVHVQWCWALEPHLSRHLTHNIRTCVCLEPVPHWQHCTVVSETMCGAHVSVAVRLGAGQLSVRASGSTPTPSSKRSLWTYMLCCCCATCHAAFGALTGTTRHVSIAASGPSLELPCCSHSASQCTLCACALSVSCHHAGSSPAGSSHAAGLPTIQCSTCQ